MKNLWMKLGFYTSSFLACTVMAFASGCASGGYKLSRQYAGWLNSQNTLLRVVLYLLTAVVFVFTMLIDYVVFNTMDFWQGKVSANSYEHEEGDKIYQVKHEFKDGTMLKRSTIRVLETDRKLIQEVVLNETASGEIEMYVDGKLKTRVNNITSIPVASIYDDSGKLTEEKPLLFNDSIRAISMMTK